MDIRGFSGLLTISLLLSLSPSYGKAQDLWIPAGTNVYDSASETLILPNVTVLSAPGPNTTNQVLLNTRFKFMGDNLFELISVDELRPEQECTREEVLNAIPQLRLDLTVAEANALIGCNAALARGQIDLEKGLLVTALWTGADGVPNPGATGPTGYYNPASPLGQPIPSAAYNPFFVVDANAQGTAFMTTQFLSGIDPANRPFIQLALRENELESYSFSTGLQTSFEPLGNCTVDLLPGFELISIGDSYTDVAAKLPCESSLLTTTISAEGEHKAYTWHSNLVSQSIGIGSGFVIQGNQTIRLSLLNGLVTTLTLDSNSSISSTETCSVEQLREASELLKAGDSISNATDVLQCRPRFETYYSDGTSKVRSFTWQTSLSSPSFFNSVNRQLRITLNDETVTSIQFRRI